MRFRTGRFLFNFERESCNRVMEYLSIYVGGVKTSETKNTFCLGITIINFDFSLTFSI